LAFGNEGRLAVQSGILVRNGYQVYNQKITKIVGPIEITKDHGHVEMGSKDNSGW
jgi:hypothetical protein